MAQFDPKIDAYIANAADFAQPVLARWRQLIHDTCPEVAEAIKWGIPHFDYKGDFMFVVASYKNHCSFTFLKADLMSDLRLRDSKNLKPIQRFLGKVTSLADLPPEKEFITLLKEAVALNEKGIKISAPKQDKPEKPTVLETPDYFEERLTANPKAQEIFESKSNSFRKEYIIWISDAKTEETRQKRMDEALEWIAEGKGRFWKFKK